MTNRGCFSRGKVQVFKACTKREKKEEVEKRQKSKKLGLNNPFQPFFAFGGNPGALCSFLSSGETVHRADSPILPLSCSSEALEEAFARGAGHKDRERKNQRTKKKNMRPVAPVLPRPPTPVPASVAVAAAATEAGHQALMVATTVVWMLYKTPVVSGEMLEERRRIFFCCSFCF